MTPLGDHINAGESMLVAACADGMRWTAITEQAPVAANTQDQVLLEALKDFIVRVAAPERKNGKICIDNSECNKISER